MSSSLLLTNFLFCSCAIAFLIPLLNNRFALLYKHGIPVVFLLICIFIKLCTPYEFGFMTTLKSRTLLPLIKVIENFELLRGIHLKYIFILIWVVISLLILIHHTHNYIRISKVISLVQLTKDNDTLMLLKNLCTLKGMLNIPRVVVLDIYCSPFVLGLCNPTIVIPSWLPKQSMKYVIMHELEHIKRKHLYVKFAVELMMILFWWNPVIWILRKSVFKALEFQADSFAIKELVVKEQVSYMETLLQFMKLDLNEIDVFVPTAFIRSENITKTRIVFLCNEINRVENKKSNLFYCIYTSIITLLMICSCTFTFEAYSHYNDKDFFRTLYIDESNSYIRLNAKGYYDLYVDDEQVHTFLSIPKDFRNIPILH